MTAQSKRGGAKALPQCAVATAIVASAAMAGCVVAISDVQAQGWRTATFTGARVRIVVEATQSRAFGRWLAKLPEADLSMFEHLAADVHYEATPTSIVVHVLTVETTR